MWSFCCIISWNNRCREIAPNLVEVSPSTWVSQPLLFFPSTCHDLLGPQNGSTFGLFVCMHSWTELNLMKNYFRGSQTEPGSNLHNYSILWFKSWTAVSGTSRCGSAWELGRSRFSQTVSRVMELTKREIILYLFKFVLFLVQLCH